MLLKRYKCQEPEKETIKSLFKIYNVAGRSVPDSSTYGAVIGLDKCKLLEMATFFTIIWCWSVRNTSRERLDTVDTLSSSSQLILGIYNGEIALIWIEFKYRAGNSAWWWLIQKCYNKYVIRTTQHLKIIKWINSNRNVLKDYFKIA